METNPNAFQHKNSVKGEGNKYFPVVAITNLDHAKMLHLAKGEIVGFAHDEEVEMNYIEMTNTRDKRNRTVSPKKLDTREKLEKM